MSSSPSLSIIVPFYNAEKTLGRCIESILRIKSILIEVLLVNDGSTDKSRMICSHYVESDDRVFVFDEPNSGSSSARNLGLSHAKGDYITFVDSDDFVDSDGLVRFFLYISNNNFDICYSDFFGGAGVTLDKRISQNYGSNAVECVKSMMLLKMQGYSWNKIYDGAFLKNSGQFFLEGTSMWEDLSFNIRLFSIASRIGYAEDVCYYHYDYEGNPTSITHSSGISTQKEQKRFNDMVKNIDMALEFIERNGKTNTFTNEILWLKMWIRNWLLKNNRAYLERFLRLYTETNDLYRQKWKSLNLVFRLSSNLMLRGWISQYLIVTSIGNKIYGLVLRK